MTEDIFLIFLAHLTILHHYFIDWKLIIYLIFSIPWVLKNRFKNNFC